jgi:hypothetical protein
MAAHSTITSESRGQITSEYLSADERLQLPIFSHLKSSTLAKWRQLGKGPKSTIVGGRPFYRRGVIEEWLREEEMKREHKGTSRTLALPISSERHGIRWQHWFTGNQTESQRSPNN